MGAGCAAGAPIADCGVDAGACTGEGGGPLVITPPPGGLLERAVPVEPPERACAIVGAGVKPWPPPPPRASVGPEKTGAASSAAAANKAQYWMRMPIPPFQETYAANAAIAALVRT